MADMVWSSCLREARNVSSIVITQLGCHTQEVSVTKKYLLAELLKMFTGKSYIFQHVIFF